MINTNEIEYAVEGHEAILGVIQKKFQLTPQRTYKTDKTLWCVANTSEDECLFIKIRGFQKNERNLGRFKGIVNANEQALKHGGDIMPKSIEFRAFEDNGVYWLTEVNEYGGEPISHSEFISAEPKVVDDSTITSLQNCISLIQKIPSPRLFYHPQSVSQIITSTFGAKAPSSAAEWTSAHCDFHWGNILSGAKFIVDWDMFSLAPKSFDIASLVIFSSNNQAVYSSLFEKFADDLADDSAQVAILFAAARLITMMKNELFKELRIHEGAIREAVAKITGVTTN